MKPFTTSLLGSMPRSQALLMARKKHALGKITTAELNQLVIQETKQIVELQQRTGIDIITSGELLRDNYLSFIAQKIQGATLMSMSEMLDHIKEKQIFESMLETLDVPALSIKNAICVGKCSHRAKLLAARILASENAITLAQIGMRIGGGKAYNKMGPMERYLRDALASQVMAPSVDVLNIWLGKAITGQQIP